MRRRRLLFLVPAAALVLVLALAGIATAAGHPSARKATSKQAVVTRPARPSSATILVNARAARSTCSRRTRAARARAPAPARRLAAMTTGKPRAGRRREPKLLGTTKRSDGMQATYNGRPLYRSSWDTAAGQTTGQGSTAFGAAWLVTARTATRS